MRTDDEHRWRCLARYVVEMDSRAARREFLARFQLHNNLAAREKLEALIRDEWSKRHARTR